MNISLPRYEKYKDSGVEWLGEIPEHWKMEKAKWIFQQVKRPIRKIDEVVTCFRDGQVTLRSNRRIEGFTNAIQEHGYQGIRKGDLVIHAMDAFAGAIGVSDSDGKSTPVYSVCLPRDEYEINSYFYAYLLRYIALSGFILSLAKGIRERSTDFRYKDFAELLLPVPEIAEQKRIAEFLDRKCGEIDEAICKKQRLIELLEGQKNILINQAVTKGLDPDVPMKDSGIEWLGAIPEHWRISKIGHYAKVSNGSTPSRDRAAYWRGGKIAWLSSGKVNEARIKEPSELITAKALKECSIRIYPKGSVVIGLVGQGKTRGTSSILEIEACINQNMAAIETNKNLIADFLLRFLTQAYQVIRNYGKGGNQEALNCELVRSFKVVVPPINEQKKIIEYSEKIEKQSSELLQLFLLEIDKLIELKQILIAEAVTGKIKV